MDQEQPKKRRGRPAVKEKNAVGTTTTAMQSELPTIEGFLRSSMAMLSPKNKLAVAPAPKMARFSVDTTAPTSSTSFPNPRPPPAIMPSTIPKFPEPTHKTGSTTLTESSVFVQKTVETKRSRRKNNAASACAMDGSSSATATESSISVQGVIETRKSRRTRNEVSTSAKAEPSVEPKSLVAPKMNNGGTFKVPGTSALPVSTESIGQLELPTKKRILRSPLSLFSSRNESANAPITKKTRSSVDTGPVSSTSFPSLHSSPADIPSTIPKYPQSAQETALAPKTSQKLWPPLSANEFQMGTTVKDITIKRRQTENRGQSNLPDGVLVKEYEMKGVGSLISKTFRAKEFDLTNIFLDK